MRHHYHHLVINGESAHYGTGTHWCPSATLSSRRPPVVDCPSRCRLLVAPIVGRQGESMDERRENGGEGYGVERRGKDLTGERKEMEPVGCKYSQACLLRRPNAEEAPGSKLHLSYSPTQQQSVGKSIPEVPYLVTVLPSYKIVPEPKKSDKTYPPISKTTANEIPYLSYSPTQQQVQAKVYLRSLTLLPSYKIVPEPKKSNKTYPPISKTTANEVSRCYCPRF
uniref:Uncharacterized protein n=1 Tax=Oryza rufipogon TaxID=4529 RepID=A0A0E0NUY4_ORYRU